MRTTLLVVFLAAFFAPSAGAWSWPVDGAVQQSFAFDPAHPYAGGQSRGIAIAGTTGAPVVAPAAGTVTFAGSVPTYGKTVTITTADGYAVTLTHLGTIGVAQGATVDEGAGVGTVADDPFVHLGIRVASEPNGYVDPLGLLPARPSAPPPTPAPAVEAAPPASTPVPAPAPAVSTPPAPEEAPAVPVETPEEPAADAPTPPPDTSLEVELPPAPLTVAAAPRHAVPVAVTASHPVAAKQKPHVPTVRSVVRRVVSPVPRRKPTGAVAPVRRTRPAVHHRAVPHVPVRVPRAPVAPRPRHVSHAPVLPLALGLLAVALLVLAARRKATPTMAVHALLRDHAHLLRQRPPAHRSLVHDDRGGHPRAPSQAARRRDVLSHRRRRARDKGLARR